MGPRFVWGGGIQDFGHAFSNYTYFRPCGRFSLSSVQRPWRLQGEKNKEERSTGKILVRRHTMSGGLINDVLPIKAARRDAIANLKSFWASELQRLNFDGFIYVTYAASPYSAGTLIIANVCGGYR